MKPKVLLAAVLLVAGTSLSGRSTWAGEMVLVPAGGFSMGTPVGEGADNERPVHTVQVNAFLMDKCEVSYAWWTDVKTWAGSHGYGFDYAGSGLASNHPVQTVNWFDAVKWCNARSEQEGLTPVYWRFWVCGGISDWLRHDCNTARGARSGIVRA